MGSAILKIQALVIYYRLFEIAKQVAGLVLKTKKCILVPAGGRAGSTRWRSFAIGSQLTFLFGAISASHLLSSTSVFGWAPP